jgi:hypothetical protein
MQVLTYLKVFDCAVDDGLAVGLLLNVRLDDHNVRTSKEAAVLGDFLQQLDSARGNHELRAPLCEFVGNVLQRGNDDRSNEYVA